MGSARFVDKLLRSNGISCTSHVVDAGCGTGAISRVLTGFGYKNITAFDKSRAMLSEAFRLCNHLPTIKLLEDDIESINLEEPAKAISWLDFSTNFSLTAGELSRKISNLVKNLTPSGILIFDIRTATGWNVDFFKQKVTAYETDNFQRIWVNLPDYKKGQITFDIFIRTKDRDGEWLSWEREQMTERMWNLGEAQEIVEKVDDTDILGIYRDDFTKMTANSHEPGLAYFVLRRG